MAVHAVCRLAPDDAVRALDHLGGDLLAAVRRQAVQHDGVGRGLLDERLVDGEAGEGGAPVARSSSWPIEVHTSV